MPAPVESMAAVLALSGADLESVDAVAMTLLSAGFRCTDIDAAWDAIVSRARKLRGEG